MAKKRADGEGSIRKRSDGRWEGRYTAGYHSETGKRIIKNVLGKTQAECKAKLSAALESVKSIDVSRADEYTVATWLRSWYDIYAKPNIRVATADRYHLMVEQYTIPRIGNIKLTKLTAHDLQKLYKELMENGRINRKSGHGNPGLSSTTVRSPVQPANSPSGSAVTEPGRVMLRAPLPSKTPAESAVTACPSICDGTVRVLFVLPSGVSPVRHSPTSVRSKTKQPASAFAVPDGSAAVSSPCGISGSGIPVGLLSPSIALRSRTSCRVNTVLPLAFRWKFVS